MESRDKQILDLAMEAGKTLLDAGRKSSGRRRPYRESPKHME